MGARTDGMDWRAFGRRTYHHGRQPFTPFYSIVVAKVANHSLSLFFFTTP
jgi:hypothetical protein